MIQTGRSHSQKVFNRTPDYCVSWPEIITKPLSDHFVALNGVGLELYVPAIEPAALFSVPECLRLSKGW